MPSTEQRDINKEEFNNKLAHSQELKQPQPLINDLSEEKTDKASLETNDSDNGSKFVNF